MKTAPDNWIYRPNSTWVTKERPSKISVPTLAHPLARLTFAEMNRQRVTYQEMEFRAGLLVSTLKSWRNEKMPGLRTVEAALGALGWALVPVPVAKRIPAWVQGELDNIASRWGREEPLLHTLLAGICGAPAAVLGSPTPERSTQ